MKVEGREMKEGEYAGRIIYGNDGEPVALDLYYYVNGELVRKTDTFEDVLKVTVITEPRRRPEPKFANTVDRLRMHNGKFIK